MEQIHNLKEFFTNQKHPYKDKATPFNWVTTDQFLPLLKDLIAEAKSKLELIKTQTQPANFENSVVAIEHATEDVDRLVMLFGNLESAHGDEKLHALSQEFYPLISAFQSDLSLDPILFSKISTIYANKNNLSLNNEQINLLEKYYKSFVRNGANLSVAAKEKLRAIDQKLAQLTPQFSENTLKATNQFQMVLQEPAELKGLPESSLEAAKMAAEAKGLPGRFLFTLQAPSFLSFIKYAENRKLREKFWRAYSSKCFNDDFDNQKIIHELLSLRAERAQLLGYKDHPSYVLEERMARDSETVLNFLNRLVEPSKKAALKDLKDLQEFAFEYNGQNEIKPWDTAFFSEKLKEKKYSLSDEELRPYFQLEKVVDGVFVHAQKLYGLHFKESQEYPVYHPEVKAYEIFDENNKYLGLLYTDFFPRETKRAGAWMTNYREQGLFLGEIHRPHVGIVCNFTKPTATKPSLLTYDEVRTLFHEFGHALHSILSDCEYRQTSGTNVYWDFVELPSQIMENWASEKEGLDLFAAHYKTGEKIPASLVEKIKKVNLFQSGTFSLRQIHYAILDLKIHMTPPDQVGDLEQFEDKALADLRIIPKEKGTCILTSFSHIFAGGYSAGYYSYKWAEVLDADAFEYFKKSGIFNREVAQLFRDNILSRGGTEHPMELYKKFRGREPDPDALLRRDGLI